MKNRSGMQKMASVYVADLGREFKEEPFDLKPASAGVDGKLAGETRTDHVVFKQERVCRVSFLQRVRPCGKVSALRCFAVVSQKRKDGLSLLRI